MVRTSGSRLRTVEGHILGANEMRKVGHGRIPLTNYHMDRTHPVSLEVDVYLCNDGQIKLVYAPTRSNDNFLVIEDKHKRKCFGSCYKYEDCEDCPDFDDCHDATATKEAFVG